MSDPNIQSQLDILKQYTACDISDALLKLKVPGAGFVPDLVHRNPSPTTTTIPLLAPACTVLFLPKSTTSPPPPSALPNPNLHFADQLDPNSIVIISQPPNQYNAVVGGIVAARMDKLGVKGVVVDGRVRDLNQLRELEGMPILSLGTSTISAGAFSTPHAINIPITLSCGLTINPGDILFLTPSSYNNNNDTSSVVSIPQTLLPKIIEILPAMVEADERALEDVKSGVGITEAFRRWRG